MKHNVPDNYPVLCYCSNCGNDFAGDTYFDKHRVGKHEYTYSEGLQFDPPVEDGRRCMTPDEMLEAGMRPMTKEEMLDSKRHTGRAKFNVLMWFDPLAAERARGVFAGSLGPDDGENAS